MSGLEIAGLVLGAFPVAITALEKYEQGARRLGLFFKIKREYKRWHRDLCFHQLTLSRHLNQLLLPLVVDNAKIDELLREPGGKAWQDPSISILLQDRLRESYPLYLDYIQGMQQVMEEINKELAMDSEPIRERIQTEPPSSIGSARIKAAMNTSKENRAYQLYKVKFCNGEANRKRLFDELKGHSDKLEKLLDSSDKDASLLKQRSMAANGAAIEASICNFWHQATRVFKALSATLSNCKCQDHTASLLLQHRTSRKPEFHVFFVGSLLRPACWELRRTRIVEGSDPRPISQDMWKENLKAESLSPHDPSHRQTQPFLKSAMRSSSSSTLNIKTMATEKTKSAQILVSHPPQPEHTASTTLISNLCSILRSWTMPRSKTEEPCCGYLLSEDDRRYYVYAISHHSKPDSVKVITLDQVLRGEVQPRPSRSQLYGLALVMASSFLQLLESPWLPSTAFRKTDVCFVRSEAEEEDCGRSSAFLLDQPLIRRQFGPQDRNGCTNDDQQQPKDTTQQLFSFADSLDHLGILLLELCFGKPLESQPCRQRWGPGDAITGKVFDVMAAREWQCHVNDEAGMDYAEAVAWCLGGNRSTPDRWRQDMLKKVILPLQRCRDYLTTAPAPQQLGDGPSWGAWQ